MGEVILRESGRTFLKESDTKKGIFHIKIISADVQGSSGYYPASVLERDGARAFPKGTHMFLDHSTESEDWERPERSVKDLAAFFTEDPVFLENGPDGAGLYVHTQVLPHQLEFVESIMDVAGVSIAATGIREYNPDTDREEVTALLHGRSVDIVTRAGAGGRILEMTESARPAGNSGPIFAELKEADKAGLQKIYESMSALTPLVESLQAKITALEEKAATAEKKREEESTLSLGDIVAKLDDSGLPGVSRKHLANTYAPGVDLDAAIADEKARVDAIRAEVSGEGTKDEAQVGEEQRESGRGVGRVQAGSTQQDVYESARDLTNTLFG